MHKNFSGVILAGGKSSRMGLPKAFLSLKEKRMIDIIVDVFQRFFEEIFIITDDKNLFSELKGAKVIEDLIKGRGPLGGIYTGLESISKDKAFFIACDMPLLRNDLIKRLLDISTQDEYDCIVPYASGGIEPLHAIYSKKILSTVKDLLMENDLSIKQLLARCKCKYVKVENGVEASFFNVNTPQDYKKLSSNV